MDCRISKVISYRFFQNLDSIHLNGYYSKEISTISSFS